MTLSPAFLDELRARTTLSAIIAPAVKLTKAGREYKACCPFHSEKTPSFTVNDEKGFYHCFGCGAHGDAIRFLTDQRGMPFMDAVKELAAKAGMEVPAPDPRAQERAEKSAGLTDVMAAAQAWFVEQLAGTEGSAARDYLAKRGIDGATAARFGIGFAPDSRGRLKTALAHFGEDALVESGMLIRPEEQAKDAYDRFRGRLMIPIRDVRGRVIAFGGRILGPGEPKYLNSPDTPLFDKGRTLYNIDRAGPASRKAGRLVVVEGYMDVIALDRAGMAEAVAPNGTALTERQLMRLWRLDPQPVLCFDGDAAGQKAAIRAALRALPHLAPDRTLRFIALPAGQDPDDLLRERGAEAVKAALEATEPLVERLWRHEAESEALATPEARAGLKARLMEHSGAIADPNVRQLYRDEFLRRFDALVRPQRATFAPRPQWKKDRAGKWQPPAAPASDVARAIGSGGIDAPTARALVEGFVLFPQALHDHLEALAHLPLGDRPSAALRDRLVEAALAGAELDRDGLATILALGEAPLAGPPAMGFSFTRRDSDPARAVSDLAAAVEIVAAAQEVETALAAATERLKINVTDDAYAEQQRLMAARSRLHSRLASLAGNE
ncbi:DNA primase [Sphingomonas mesophila]|uniref:DNA primase n=1 Tax=Sphingomonas mesophila TaxID=2303576 RepID=UPI000E56AFF6|nr:DNA primase [Sphingomonas mesophila]